MWPKSETTPEWEMRLSARSRSRWRQPTIGICVIVNFGQRGTKADYCECSAQCFQGGNWINRSPDGSEGIARPRFARPLAGSRRGGVFLAALRLGRKVQLDRSQTR